MPIVVMAVEAMLDPRFELLRVQAHSPQPGTAPTPPSVAPSG
jgi:hypothetical protein